MKDKKAVCVHLLAVHKIIVFFACSHHQLAFCEIPSCHGSLSIDNLEQPCIIKKYAVASAIVHQYTDHFLLRFV